MTRDLSPEMADVIAYLEQRRDNAATIAAAKPNDEGGIVAADRRRQLDIQIKELRAGLHDGSFAVRSRLHGAGRSE